MMFYWRSAIVIAIIAYLCLRPSSDFSVISIPFLDKLAHAIMHLGLAFALLFDTYLKGNLRFKQQRYGVFVISALYGGLIEILQYYLPFQRSAEWADMLANISGTILGIAFFSWCMRKILVS